MKWTWYYKSRRYKVVRFVQTVAESFSVDPSEMQNKQNISPTQTCESDSSGEGFLQVGYLYSDF